MNYPFDDIIWLDLTNREIKVKSEQFFLSDFYRKRDKSGDIILICSGKKEHKVHRFIIEQNKVFQEIILNSENEKIKLDDNSYNLYEFDAEEIEWLILGLYHQSIKFNKDEIEKVLRILDMFEIISKKEVLNKINFFKYSYTNNHEKLAICNTDKYYVIENNNLFYDFDEKYNQYKINNLIETITYIYTNKRPDTTLIDFDRYTLKFMEKYLKSLEN